MHTRQITPMIGRELLRNATPLPPRVFLPKDSLASTLMPSGSRWEPTNSSDSPRSHGSCHPRSPSATAALSSLDHLLPRWAADNDPLARSHWTWLLPGDTAVHIPLETSPLPASRQSHQGLRQRASPSHTPAASSVPPTLALRPVRSPAAEWSPQTGAVCATPIPQSL
jgi:hypothetical protein